MQTYQHSGAVSPIGLIIAPLAGGFTALFLGAIYSVFIAWMPFIYLCFLGTIFFGVVIGVAVGWASQLGKIRNTLFVALVGFSAGLLGIYVEWALTPVAQGNFEVGLSGFDPRVMLAVAQHLYENGSWGFGNAPLTGIFLAIIWMAEALMIFGASTFVAISFTATLPFCERCYQWTKTEEAINAFNALTTGEETLARLRTGDLAALNELPPLEQKVARYVQVDANSCPGCGQSNFLTIKLVLRSLDDKAKESLDTDELVTNMVVTLDEIAFARQAGKAATA